MFLNERICFEFRILIGGCVLGFLYKGVSAIRFGGLKCIFKWLISKYKNDDGFKELVYEKSLKAKENDYPKILAYIYGIRTGRKLDWNNIRTFNEKVQWLKLYDNQLIKTQLSDKYAVRDWVREKIGEQYLIPIYGAWDNFDEIDFDVLPSKFVLKCNHGNACNVIVTDKAKMDRVTLKNKFDNWMNTQYAFKNGFQLQYKDIPRKIVAEEYIEQLDGDLLDYKIHCFGGKPEIIQIIGSRDLDRHTAQAAFYDSSWNRVSPLTDTYEPYEYELEPPRNLSELLATAKTLSEDFKYVRVDLYDLDGKILFGEMTFTPGSGFFECENENTSLFYGNMIKCCD